MVSLAELDQVRQALNRLSSAARAAFMRLWDESGNLERAELVAALQAGWIAILEHFGSMASGLAADLFEVQATDAGIRPQVAIAAAVDPARALARLAWALSTPNPRANAAVVLDELVKQPYRTTYQDSVVKSGGKWARVPTGAKTCAFCLMLASRGAVYRSKDTADGNRYHGDCDCTPVLVVGDEYPEGYDPETYREIYRLAAREAEGPGAKGVLAEIRKQQETH